MQDKIVDLKYAKLHLIKTKKFRSINIKILLSQELKKEDITKRNFLTDYLILSTKKYKTKRMLALKIQELYSLYINAYTTRIGKNLITRFNMSLLNPKYTEENMLSESIDLLSEIIFNPNVKSNKFESKNFNVIKNNILTEIKTIKENPKTYANIRMFENMDYDMPYTYHGYGYLEDLNNIDPKNLYEYYKEFIYKSDVDIYIIGDFVEDEIIKLVREKLNFKTFKNHERDIYIKHSKLPKKIKTVVESDDFNQSKLSIGCKISNLTDFERKYVINLYSMILGGGFNSKFMSIIREKKSLAYYINSSVNKADNILLIQSGISDENFSLVVSNIKKIMKSIQKGEVSESELASVKMEYLSVLDESLDNIDSILENQIAADLLDLDDLETRRKEINKVLVEDIVNISKKIRIDTIYLLKGESHEKK